jgi:hypothetical protein
MFGSKQRQITRLLNELHTKNARAWEAIDKGDCAQALDHYTSVIRRYTEAYTLMHEIHPSSDLAANFEHAAMSMNETRNHMQKCLCGSKP